MSFFGLGGKSGGPSSAEKIHAVETELEMVSDMFNRLVTSCSRKCIPNDYREAELNKGESVCLDRCVSKFFDVNMRVSEKMQQDSQSRQAGGGGMGGGMFGA